MITTMDKWIMHLRNLAVIISGFLIGKYLGDTPIDQELWNIIVGGVVGAFSIWWSIKDRVLNEEKLQSFLKSLMFAVGGVGVAIGWFDEKTSQAIGGISTIAATVIYELISEGKSAKIGKGKIAIADLMGVDETKPQLIQPVVEAKNIK